MKNNRDKEPNVSLDEYFTCTWVERADRVRAVAPRFKRTASDYGQEQ